MSNTLSDRITPGLIKELIPIGVDSILSYISQSPKITPDQIEAALLSGLMAFLSTIKNGGHHDEAYNAAVSATKSLPQAVDAANIVADKYRSPNKKLNVTLKAATGLISRAALTSLPSFPEEKKEKIANDIESILNVFTIIPKKSLSKKKGLFGSGVGNFENNLNTEWLNPNEESLIGGWSWSDLNPLNWFGSNVQSVDQPFIDQGTSSDALIPLGPPGPLEQAPRTLNDIYGKEILDINRIENETGGYPSSVSSAAKTAGTAGLLSAITGNPYLVSLGLQLTPTIAKYVFPVLGGLAGGVIDGTFGNLRRYVRSQSWRDKPDDGWWEKTKNYLGRAYKNQIARDDRFAKSVKAWYSEWGMNDKLKDLGTSLEYILPSIGQDYMNYTQQMDAYNQQQTAAKQQHNYIQQQRKAEIDRENAIIKSANAKERSEAELYNKYKTQEFENEKEYFKKLEQYDKDFKKAKLEYMKALREYEQDVRAQEIKQKSFTNLLNAGKGIAELGIYGAAWYFGGPLAGVSLSGVGASGVADLTNAIYGHYTNVDKQADTTIALLEQAKVAEENGNKNLADEYKKKAAKEAELLKNSMSKALNAEEKLRNERNKMIKDITNTEFDVASNIADYYFLNQKAGLVKPIDTSDLIQIPRRKPPTEPLLKYVPEEIKDDDPRLRQFIEQPFYDTTPKPFFKPLYTLNTIQNVLPHVITKKTPEPATKLPYVNPLPVTHVDPASGSSNTLRTRTYMVQKNPSLFSTTPLANRNYSYHRSTPMMSKSLNRLQPPSKRGRIF